jgi:hypothetical protein
MITISKGATNSTVFTLKEMSELTNPTYVFLFHNDFYDSYVTFSAVNVSPYDRRYDRFEIVESSTPDPINGVIELEYGFGSYTVYESATQSLDINLSTGRILEYGRYFVPGNPVDFSETTNEIYL